MAITLYVFYLKTKRIDLLFPVYLLFYLLMRFAIEFVRAEPRIWGNLTIYQLLGMAFIPIIAGIIIDRSKAHA
jgi:prolipoprotein diacylglyceryltransferase